jgi:hypothetical protein
MIANTPLKLRHTRFERCCWLALISIAWSLPHNGHLMTRSELNGIWFLSRYLRRSYRANVLNAPSKTAFKKGIQNIPEGIRYNADLLLHFLEEGALLPGDPMPEPPIPLPQPIVVAGPNVKVDVDGE